MRTTLFAMLSGLLMLAVAPQAHAYDPNQAALVDSWYVRYLGRHADPGGLAVHAEGLNQGADAALIEAAILVSPEYYNRNGGTEAGFITGLYRDAFGVNATPQQVNQTAQALAFGGDRQQYIAEFLRSNRGVSQVAVPVQTYQPTYVVPAPVYRSGYAGYGNTYRYNNGYGNFYGYGNRRPSPLIRIFR